MTLLDDLNSVGCRPTLMPDGRVRWGDLTRVPATLLERIYTESAARLDAPSESSVRGELESANVYGDGALRDAWNRVRASKGGK